MPIKKKMEEGRKGGREKGQGASVLTLRHFGFHDQNKHENLKFEKHAYQKNGCHENIRFFDQ